MIKFWQKKKKKSAEKSPECEKKINMVSGVVGKENPLQNRGLCASQIFGRFFPGCESQVGPVRAWIGFKQDWLQAPQGQVGPVRVWIGFEQDWLQAPQSQVGPVRVWIGFEEDWLQAPQGQVGPVRVWIGFEQDWLQAPQSQMGSDRLWDHWLWGGSNKGNY